MTWPDRHSSSGSLSSGARPSHRVARALERIDAIDAEVRAWVVVDRDNALRATRSMDRAPNCGPLWGMPFGVKDVIDVAGLPTGCGSAVRRGHVAQRDAWVVARLREAGAVPVGKTVTTEFAYFSPGPTRNPRDLARTPGGSSSGSAAAVAAGMVPFALGTQTAGSVTRPAGFCGVAGYVAPRGALSLDGIVGMCPSLDSLGVLATSVARLQRVHEALTGEARSSRMHPPRLAVWDGTSVGDVSSDMLLALGRASAAAANGGAELERLTSAVPVVDLVAAHCTVMAYEAARSRTVGALEPDRLSTKLRDLLATGRGISSAEHQSALGRAAEAHVRLAVEWKRIDAILAPAALGAAPLGLGATGSPVLSRPWQLLGLPTITIPGLVDNTGAPLGIQLVGRPERVGSLMAIARWLEAAIAAAQ